VVDEEDDDLVKTEAQEEDEIGEKEPMTCEEKLLLFFDVF